MIEYLSLLPILYFSAFVFWTIIKSINPLFNKLVFCTTCASFFSVMILSFFLKFDTKILIFMIGMTVTGITYWLDEIIEEFPAKRFLLQLLLTEIALFLVIKFINTYNI